MAKAKSNRNLKGSPLLGRCFVHPLFDYLLIGGGLSLLVIPIVRASLGERAMMSYSMLPWFILFSNSAHLPLRRCVFIRSPARARRCRF